MSLKTSVMGVKGNEDAMSTVTSCWELIVFRS